ncbi:hypothetical protein [Streptomyces sp. NBC_01373]|uniref:hypothetical protein n=1 Tax=Streptomyces sp. NBC_01373 TaxID=2903843 RepID=UPI0022560215|nr:hypothetical protein [Streptomyces sp. NBC_01373]MCX4702062.1 hypothetical protein [Streptomyces sp. NBC_01373]
MSDSSAERSGPDFLDRLIARHAAPATAPRPGAGRVRPRLPGPFERVEAVRAQAATPDGDGLLWPSTTPTVLPPPDAPRPAASGEARVYTERERTVVRTERAPAEPASRPAAQAAPEIPLLRPAAPLVPRQVPSAAGRRAAGQGRSDRGADRPAASVPTLPGADAAPPPSCPRRCAPPPRTRRPHGTPYARPRPGDPRGRPSRWCRCRSAGWK